jgi:hypothetical protein
MTDRDAEVDTPRHVKNTEENIMRCRFVGVVIAALCAVTLMTAVPTAASASSSTGFAMKTVKVKAAGISLQYPSTWIALPLSKKRVDAVKKLLAKRNPKLDAAISEIDPTLFKFYGTDTVRVDGGFANVQVVAQHDVGAIGGLSGFKDQARMGAKLLGATILDTEKVEVSNKTAYLAHLEMAIKLPSGAPIVCREGQLFIQRGNDVTDVSVTAPAGTSVPVIDRILRSVREI